MDNQSCRKLIQLYGTKELLWNTKNIYEMKMPTEVLKEKMKVLLSSYRREKWKINKSQTTGSDEDVDRLFFLGSPLPLFLVVMAYLIFVLKIGPEYMKNRKPFELKKLMICYNIFQVIYCTMLFKKAFLHYMEVGFWHDTCLSKSEKYRSQIIDGSHLYLGAKLLDLFDTVFFVLRKKDSQITFLHVYHHASMIVTTYLIFKFALSENYMFGAALNTFVHIIMYSYYALSALGPSVAKYLWWKKYLTKMQMTQFALMFIDVSIREYRSVCPRQKLIFGIAIWQIFVITSLFADFYIKAYKKNHRTKITTAVNGKNINYNAADKILKQKTFTEEKKRI